MGVSGGGCVREVDVSGRWVCQMVGVSRRLNSQRGGCVWLRMCHDGMCVEWWVCQGGGCVRVVVNVLVLPQLCVCVCVSVWVCGCGCGLGRGVSSLWYGVGVRLACVMHLCFFLPFPQENIFKLTNSQLRQREVGKELSASIVFPAPAVSTMTRFSIVPVFQACLE